MNDSLHCKELIKTLSDYIDGELDDALCVDLEKHLSECDNCRVVVDALRKTIELYRDDSTDEKLPQDVRERLFHCLDLEEYVRSS